MGRHRAKLEEHLPVPDSTVSLERARAVQERMEEMRDIGDEHAFDELNVSYLTHRAWARLANAGVHPASRPELPRQLRSLGEADLAADLETERGNSIATRNVRLAAVHAFVRYAAMHHPEHLELCQQILAVPFKRAPQNVVEYLEADELQALLEAPGLHYPGRPARPHPDHRRGREDRYPSKFRPPPIT